MSDENITSPPSEEPTTSEESSSQEPVQSSNGESSSSASAPKAIRHCDHCNALETEEKALKPCSKCQTALYCSRDCQKGNFKVHKKTCAKDAQIYALKADLKPSAPPRAPKENFRGGLQKWQFDT